jgi:hypothetical protein
MEPVEIVCFIQNEVISDLKREKQFLSKEIEEPI